MAGRVTIQDIADSLGISRNTVSKAINNSPGLAEDTRAKILQRAAEMGYKQFSYLSQMSPDLLSPVQPGAPSGAGTAQETAGREIAFFTAGFLFGSHFAITMLDQFQLELSKWGYTLTMHRISQEELQALRLPVTFSRRRTSGIICAELFQMDYAQMLMELELPLLFADSPVGLSRLPFRADRLMMDNRQCIRSFVAHMVENGKRQFGFIGHVRHCQSFFERYLALQEALLLQELTLSPALCITGTFQEKEYPSGEEYRSYLKGQLAALDHLPDVFLCANDFVAMDTLLVLRQLGLSVPEDVMLCGFDDSPESRFISPSLTTVRIHSKDMGTCALQMLLSRINNPDIAPRTLYVSTELIYRESAPL